MTLVFHICSRNTEDALEQYKHMNLQNNWHDEFYELVADEDLNNFENIMEMDDVLPFDI